MRAPDPQELLGFARDLTASLDARATAKLLTQKLVDLAEADLVALYVPANEGRLVPLAVAGLDDDARLPPPPSIAVRAFDEGTPADASERERAELRGSGALPGAALAIPIATESERLGVLILMGDHDQDDTARNLLTAVVEIAAASLANARRLELTLEEARSDPLTGVGNHRAFYDHLDARLREALVDGTERALVLVDLDGFKALNDGEGHVAADEVVRHLADTSRRVLRPNEELFRVGGDKFALVLAGGTAAGSAVAERVRSAVASGLVPHTVSAGVAAFPADAHTSDALVQKADIALHAAKHAGKNVALTYSADIEGTTGRAKSEISRERLRERMSVERIRSVVLADFAAVTHAVRALGREATREGVLSAAALQTTAILGATACSISEIRGDRLEEVADYWPPPFDEGPTFAEYAYLLADYPLTREVIDTEMARAVSLSDNEIEANEAFVLHELRMHAVLMLPLLVRGRVWGLVEIYDAAPRRFTEREANVAELVVDQAGALLTQLESAEDVQRLYRESLASLANALEAKDRYTHAHAQEVVALSLDVAAELGLSGDDLRAVELGALLHDVGKIRVPQAILTKAGPLSDEEWDVMRRHPEAGEAILAPITSLHNVLPIVRSSHERWDGTGYPDALRGEAIPLAARIVAVCDAFRAMVEPRPYRRAVCAEDARREITENAGTQFDPACSDALMRVLEEQAQQRSLDLHRPTGHVTE